MRFFLWLAFLVSAFVLTLRGEESGISPNPPDPTHPGKHDIVVKVSWSEADASGSIEIEHRKFTSPEDLLETVRARVAGDPDLRAIFWSGDHVPLEFGKKVMTVLRQAGIAQIAVAMPEGPITLPSAKGVPATPSPGSQLIIRVVGPAGETDSHIEIEDRKFQKADEIVDLLQARVKANPGMRILIRANRDVRYDYLKQVMIAAGKAGKVTFSVVDNISGNR